MKYFFEKYRKILKNAVVRDYESLVKLSKNEKPYCCALVTDSGAMSLFFAMNTKEKLIEKLQKVDNKYSAYYKWAPSEWTYGDHLSETKLVSKSSNVLSKKSEEKETKKEFSNFEEKLYETMTLVLKELVDENIFDNMTVFISISDDSRARNVENYSAKLINSETIYDEFMRRYEV